MIFFGHLGITTGVVKTYEKLSNNDKNSIDYRVVLVGSILPDLIDKPMGAFFFRSTFHNSRIFAHTFLFSFIILILGGYFFYRYRKNKMMSLGVSTCIHLILDSMWLYTGILFWPYYGLNFPERPEGNWAQSSLERLVSDPGYYIPEIVGLGIILFYIIKIYKSKQIKRFIKKGNII